MFESVAIDVDVDYDLSINDWQRLGYSNRFVFDSIAIDVNVDYDLSIYDSQRLGLTLRQICIAVLMLQSMQIVDYDRNIDDNDGLRPQTTALLIIIPQSRV